MRILAGANGHLTERVLAQTLSMHPTKLAVCLRGLEERDFIYRSTAYAPGMAVVKLNDRGEKYVVDKGFV